MSSQQPPPPPPASSPPLKETISSNSPSPPRPKGSPPRPPGPPAGPPPPPPPTAYWAAAASATSSNPPPPQPTAATDAQVKPKASPPSLIRGKTEGQPSSSMLRPSLTRRTTGNSVKFADNDLSKITGESPCKAAVAGSTAGSSQPSASRNASMSSTYTATKSSIQPLTLDRVISSQFEDEATTHILAALEAEEAESGQRLAGEGIDGMEDYSDDDDDHNNLGGESGGERGSTSGNEGPRKARTYSTDSFIKNLQMHDNLQQYQVPPVSGHRYASSTMSAGYLPSVPDESVENFEQRLSSYLSEDEGNEGRYVEEFKRSSSAAGSKQWSSSELSLLDQEEASVMGRQRPADRQLSDIKEDDEEVEAAEERESTPVTKNDPMKITNATKNLTTMAQRLKMMQRGSSFKGIGSSLRSSFSKSTSEEEGEKGSGDNLLDALSSAARTENKGRWNKLRFEWENLIAPKMPLFWARVSRLIFFLIVPCISVASLLFYILDNPMAGDTGTSISWWILFIGVRQSLIFEFARVGEVFWVEIMALRSKLFTKAFGPYVALAVIQSKGWPYICFWFPLLDFCFNFGSNQFVKHWLYWQYYLDVFNDSNPVVGITDNEYYLRLLLMLMFVGLVVSLKRLTLAIYLGRRTVKHFGPELEKLMAKMILIGEVADLAKEIEKKHTLFSGPITPEDDKLVQFRNIMMMEDNSSTDGIDVTPRLTSERKTLDLDPVASPSDSLGAESQATREETQRSTSTSNVKLLHLLEEWEEPESMASKNAKASVQDLLQFRQAVTYTNEKYPFSRAFGLANTREVTIESAQKVYDKLMLGYDDSQPLPFAVFSVKALDEDGRLDDAKIKSLIRLFRPDREGRLTRLDYTKSIDAVYKELRLLRASIANSAQIDIAFEKIVNTFFYFFLVIVAVTILGIKIWSVFLSINTLVLGFSFLFGSAASNYFEGLLLIFVRRPYDIGDKIATSSPSTDTPGTGSSTWFVDRVTLFTTTARFATTNEVATLSNGSLARLRIINANRSPKATVSVIIKFGLETPFQRITIFRTAVENFIKARPREWIALSAFRVTRVEADAGYVEYKIVGQHRERWQNIGPILQSKADLSSFCLEVSKKLDMRYESPPMPVNLSASGDVMKGFFESGDGSGTEEAGAPSPRGTVKPSFSSQDLQEVDNMIGRKSP